MYHRGRLASKMEAVRMTRARRQLAVLRDYVRRVLLPVADFPFHRETDGQHVPPEVRTQLGPSAVLGDGSLLGVFLAQPRDADAHLLAYPGFIMTEDECNAMHRVIQIPTAVATSLHLLLPRWVDVAWHDTRFVIVGHPDTAGAQINAVEGPAGPDPRLTATCLLVEDRAWKRHGTVHVPSEDRLDPRLRVRDDYVSVQSVGSLRAGQELLVQSYGAAFWTDMGQGCEACFRTLQPEDPAIECSQCDALFCSGAHLICAKGGFVPAAGPDRQPLCYHHYQQVVAPPPPAPARPAAAAAAAAAEAEEGVEDEVMSAAAEAEDEEEEEEQPPDWVVPFAVMTLAQPPPRLERRTDLGDARWVHLPPPVLAWILGQTQQSSAEFAHALLRRPPPRNASGVSGARARWKWVPVAHAMDAAGRQMTLLLTNLGPERRAGAAWAPMPAGARNQGTIELQALQDQVAALRS